jgi:hypothetical protein
MRMCSKCRIEKSEEEFYSSPKNKYQCKACRRSYQKKYKNPLTKENQKRTRLKLKIEVFSHYGTICQCCGESQIDFLCIDHINGGGRQERNRNKLSGGNGFYKWLRNNGYPSGYQVLCYNCNCAKRDGGVCPHRNKSPLGPKGRR